MSVQHARGRSGSIPLPLTLKIRVKTPDISAFLRYERCLFVSFIGEEALRLGREKLERARPEDTVTLSDQRPPTHLEHYLAFSLAGEKVSDAQSVIEKINRILSQPGTPFEREVPVTLYKIDPLASARSSPPAAAPPKSQNDPDL